MSPKQINSVFNTLSQHNPNPKTELYYTNDFTLLVAVVLSAQATDISVNKVTQTLFNTVKSPDDIISLGETELKEKIKTIGLYNSKAKNIMALSHNIIHYHNHTVPQDLETLMSLPGVGRKTANVVLNVLFQQPTIAVDTHVFRVSNRIGLTNAKTPLETEKQLMVVVPDKYKIDAHNLLILHGRYVCKAQKPLCNSCTIKNYCGYFKKKAHN